MYKKIKFEYRASFIYLLAGLVWVFFLDKLMFSLTSSNSALDASQNYIGGGFVVLTSVLLFVFIRQHLNRLRISVNKACEADRLKSSFLENISHEIRTPMNGIIGFSELIKEGNVSSSEKEEFLDMIGQSSEQLMSVVNNVLDIALIEAGSVKLKKNNFDINTMLEDIYLGYNVLIPKQVVFRLDRSLTDDQSVMIADEAKIKQVLNNIINNAIKFTSKGSILFGCFLQRNVVTFYVKDTGIGIKEELQETIFQRFRQADKGGSKYYGGTGLGLSISKGIVELHGGEMWVESQEGQGSSFYFTIPYMNVANDNYVGDLWKN
ncbi:ATP-binding protein [bacterium]|nr:ATP-binding protein [bacterium]